MSTERTTVSATDKPKPELVSGIITIDPLDPEWSEILAFTCVSCGPIAHKLQRAGYDIKRRAESEQSAVLMWMLSLYRDHGKEWRTKGQEFLNGLQAGGTNG